MSEPLWPDNLMGLLRYDLMGLSMAECSCIREGGDEIVVSVACIQ